MNNSIPPTANPTDPDTDNTPETAADLLSALYAKMTLPMAQIRAIMAIMAGNPPAAAARAAGVHRATLYRWMKDDAGFAGALEKCRAAVRFSTQEHLLSMTDDCIDVVERAVHDGNALVALRLLKLMGIFNFVPDVSGAGERNCGADKSPSLVAVGGSPRIPDEVRGLPPTATKDVPMNALENVTDHKNDKAQN